MKRILPIAALLAFAGNAAGAETIAITNARIETVAAAGVIASGTLVLQDGKIAAVGANVATPAGARVIDAKGRTVTPGMIAASSNLMVAEVNLIAETRDDGTGDHLSAGFDIQLGVNPASPQVAVARGTGTTRAVLTPLLGQPVKFEAEDGGDDAASLQGGGDGKFGNKDPALFGGQAAIVRLDAGNIDPVTRAKVAVVLDMGESGARHAGGSRGAALLLVKSALEDARRFAKTQSAKGAGNGEFGLSNIDLQALVPVIEGKIPLLVRVHRAADIRQVLKLARDEKLRVILEGAEEAWLVAPELAKAGVPVLLDPLEDLPSAFESLAARLDNAARLQKAGVLIGVLGSRNFNSVRPARLNAGTAVAYGLSRDEALAAVTLNPARIWGFADRAGSIETGKDGDVVIWDGDPLETTSWPAAMFIGGVEQPLGSRRQQLRDRYLKAGEGLPPAYR